MTIMMMFAETKTRTRNIIMTTPDQMITAVNLTAKLDHKSAVTKPNVISNATIMAIMAMSLTGKPQSATRDAASVAPNTTGKWCDDAV